jgi:hypothetical protein
MNSKADLGILFFVIDNIEDRGRIFDLVSKNSN